MSEEDRWWFDRLASVCKILVLVFGPMIILVILTGLYLGVK